MDSTSTSCSYESFLSAAKACIHPSNPLYTAEDVARKATDTDSCVWHAAYLLKLDAFADGRLSTATCSYCGGVADLRVGFHHLCAARAGQGMETPRLDWSPKCACKRCEDEDCEPLLDKARV